MATSVHIPKSVLEALERRARALKISRNRLIVQAIEKELARGSEWSPGFFDGLRGASEDIRAGADELLQHVHKSRRSKGPIDL
jgi:predicted transcriptional regulator